MTVIPSSCFPGLWPRPHTTTDQTNHPTTSVTAMTTPSSRFPPSRFHGEQSVAPSGSPGAHAVIVIAPSSDARPHYIGRGHLLSMQLRAAVHVVLGTAWAGGSRWTADG